MTNREIKNIVAQMKRTRAELIILANMLHEYPDKAREARSAAKIVKNWIEGVSEE